jgi:hypothetical protein
MDSDKPFAVAVYATFFRQSMTKRAMISSTSLDLPEHRKQVADAAQFSAAAEAGRENVKYSRPIREDGSDSRGWRQRFQNPMGRIFGFFGFRRGR